MPLLPSQHLATDCEQLAHGDSELTIYKARVLPKSYTGTVNETSLAIPV